MQSKEESAMPWAVEIRPKAAKALRRMPPKVRERIMTAVRVLAEDPFASRHSKALTGRDGRRLRVGEYRVIYRLENSRLIIIVIDVGPRQNIYG